jgi:hypothetical protein
MRLIADITDRHRVEGSAPAAVVPAFADSADVDAETETILSTLDSYIKALDEAEKRFVDAAASGDQDKETDAVDDLAALVDITAGESHRSGVE